MEKAPAASTSAAASRDYERHRTELLSGLLPHVIVGLGVAIALYGISEALLGPSKTLLGMLIYYPPQLLIIGLGWLILRRSRRLAPWTIVLGIDVAFTTLLCLRLAFPETTLSGTAFVLALKMAATALFVPWPPRAQDLANFASLSIFFAALLWRGTWSDEPIYVHQWVLPLLATLIASFGVRTVDGQRRLLFERNRRLRTSLAERDEQAAIAQCLVRVARELVSTVDRRELLDRLCRSTAAALNADFSHVLLWNPKREEFEFVAGHGDDAEHWEMLRSMRFPRAPVRALVESLERDGVVQAGAIVGRDLLPAGLQSQYGVTHGMFALLRVGTETVGVLTAGFRGRTEPFGARDESILHGIADTAALALTHSRLVHELQIANAVRSDFISSMSHELRTPLNVIIGYHDMLLGQEVGALNDAQHEILARLRANAVQLLELVNTILDLNRFEAQKMRIHREIIDVGPVLAEIETEMREAHRGANVDLTVTPPATPIVIRSEVTKLRVVLKSLIGNAVKFSPGGHVGVSVESADGGVEFRVTDTGIGIAQEALERIFEPFTQADPSIAERFGGTGLGLNIVQRMVDVLGGRIHVESVLGRGSTFSVWLPIDPESENSG